MLDKHTVGTTRAFSSDQRQSTQLQESFRHEENSVTSNYLRFPKINAINSIFLIVLKFSILMGVEFEIAFICHVNLVSEYYGYKNSHCIVQSLLEVNKPARG